MTLDETAARLEALLEKATKGPFAVLPPDETEMCVDIVAGDHFDNSGNILTPTRGIVASAKLFPTEVDIRDFERAIHNAKLIVEVLNALPALLAERKAMKAEIERLRGASLALRDDLLNRASFDDGAEKVVCAGSSVWIRFSEALENG